MEHFDQRLFEDATDEEALEVCIGDTYFPVLLANQQLLHDELRTSVFV